ncbi:MAG: hypothetical protein CL610_09245 [Anaerolineaceae bacterium]|nr:hypothetical protein [Anaerolineaceae bacterium]
MSPHLSIHELPDTERPRERLFQHGAGALSNAELLAIILRTGTSQENAVNLAQRILAHYDGLPGLAEAPLSDLVGIKGLGEAKVAQIGAALELAKRLMTTQPNTRTSVHRAEDAVKVVADMCYLQQEHVRIILLDLARYVMAVPTVYIGTVNASVLRVSEVLREAVIRNSPAVIVVHNHPSGDPTPSPEDIELTRTLHAAAQLMDIHLVDHLIIGRHGWTSLRQSGLGFSD